MLLYMIRDRGTDRYWKATDEFFGLGEWVEQQVASVWTTVPPLRDVKAPDATPEIVTLAATEQKDAPPADNLFPVSVTRVMGDDWVGIYIGGELLMEGHSIDECELFRALGCNVKHVDADLDWLEARGRLPEKLSDVIPEDGEQRWYDD